MTDRRLLSIGLDLGTGGARAVAVKAIVHSGRQVDPDPAWTRAYEDLLGRFQAALTERGYL